MTKNIDFNNYEDQQLRVKAIYLILLINIFCETIFNYIYAIIYEQYENQQFNKFIYFKTKIDISWKY